MKQKIFDKEKIHELRAMGKTYKEIGILFGVTHQTINRIERTHQNPILDRPGIKEIRQCKYCGLQFICYLRLPREFCSKEHKIKYRIENPTCRCGSREHLIAYSKRNGFVYFMCRKCNTYRHKVYRRTESGKYKTRRAAQKGISKHRDKQTAREHLGRAILKGTIIKPDKCSICGLVDKIYGHHTDYSKELEVLWVCSGCHADIHRKLRTPD